MSKNALISIFSLTVLQLLSQSCFGGRFMIPPIEKSLIEIQSQRRQDVLNNTFSLLVWNIHKGKAGQAWVNDIQTLGPKHDILLFQETTDDNETIDAAANELKNFDLLFAKSFTYTKTLISSGVATASVSTATNTILHRTKDLEPFVRTPKTTLLSLFKLANGETLATLNIHGINRASNEAFYRQIDESLALVRNHQGPIVFAGDFNTNKREKFDELTKRMTALGLTMITYPNDQRRNHLDWIFYRGCQVRESEILYDVQSSDHFPLHARLECN
jgi:endonuclease/exonuclease/phosphatase (EEP) superfamily protein YafD